MLYNGPRFQGDHPNWKLGSRSAGESRVCMHNGPAESGSARLDATLNSVSSS